MVQLQPKIYNPKLVEEMISRTIQYIGSDGQVHIKTVEESTYQRIQWLIQHDLSRLADMLLETLD